MASSSSSSRTWMYDVFPSFSGEDVRVTFLSHFFKELDRKLIIAFKDNEIERSQSLDPELKQAIRTSRIAVVVFSEKYPSSSWCLDELVEIVKCKEELGQLVIPVFYGLDPSHVRKQTGKFGEAFVKTCQRKTEDETKLWRKSLTDVANVLGYHSQNWPNEAKMIEAIANDVLGKLNFTPSKDFEDFVGMEDHIAKMSDLLHLESDEVRMVGIWGSSGIGKTSIARVLYNQLSRQFQGSIFIDKAFVSKSTSIYDCANPDDYNMKLYLVRNFLSEILDKKDVRINHLGAVEETLNRRKVLIFIDDLDDQVVLDTLAGQTQWFGCGSRIIVITKDKQFLRGHRIDHVYEVCLPSNELALKIFCKSAFRKNSLPHELMELASEVALSAGNLPLGLKVLGSYLRGRDKDDLMDILPRLRNSLDSKIEKTLRVSYEGLDNQKDKAIFRHIACMFNGEKVNDIKLLLADIGLDVNIGLKNLVDKSLVHVREGVVEMHSLLQKMGKEIVRAQSNEPGEREFLMDPKDSCDVLEDNTGTKNVLGITLDMDETDDELHIHENAFKRMRNLLFLEIYTNEWNQKNEVRWHLPEGFNYLPEKLRILRLEGYPMRYMPSNFHTENLVKLDMSGSKLERLWEGVHSLRGLKDIDLERSRNLKEIPNLSMATNLEKLNLSDCSSLVELPSSVQYLNKLEDLDMSRCINLEILPTGINLQSLSYLELDGCSRIKIFPDISTNISSLDLDETTIDEFPSNFRLDNLKGLSMRKMKSEKLWGKVQPLTPLMAILPHSLENLYLSDIPSLVEIPSSIQNFIKLKELEISDCINLETLPSGINLQYLEYLDLSGCSRLKTFPNISTNITNLVLKRTGIEEIPWWIENFTELDFISMEKCNNLRRVSLNIYKLKRFEADFSDCGSLTEASWNGSPSEVAMVIENMHSQFPVLDEAFYFDEDIYGPKFWFDFEFLNLDPEALLRQGLIFNTMVLSGEEVPSYFTHRTTKISLTNIPLLQTSLSKQFFKFKACAVVVFDSYLGCLVVIRVNCRFKDRFGKSFDTFGQPHWFGTNAVKEMYYLFILDCAVPLNKDNAPLAQLNYDHVDMEIQIRKVDPEENDYTFKLKGWGIRLIEECSLPENRLPHVCEADENNLVNKTEHSEEWVETVVKRQRETGSDFRLREGPVVLPVLMEQQDTRIGGNGESLQCLPSLRDVFRLEQESGLQCTFPGQSHGHTQTFKAPDDLPKKVARTLSQGSSPMSMDFHPIKQTLLLVGTNVGDIGLWEVGSRERLVQKTFKVWDLSKCSMPLQAALVKEPVVSVNRVIWSPDGSLFGVAYSWHIVQLYSYHGGEDMRQHLEIDAHVGGVNDIAFSTPNKQLCVTTCGDDKTIKVWDAATGVKRHTFEGHEAPVYSICPHYKENIQFIFSNALDGKIKAWLYDNIGSRVDQEAPGRWCTTMAYSADGTRLFSCGTSKDGESFIVEWNESEGAVKRTYQGFHKRSLGVVQFDTTKNRYLAAGDDFSIKFWDMDNIQLLTAIDADGGLQASPRIRFNKEGSLLAVSANDNMIKVMANSDGLRLLHTVENLSSESSKPAINSIPVAERPASVVSIPGMNGDSRNMVDVKPVINEESNDKSKVWKLTEVGEPSQCRSLRLPENMRVTKISRLIFTNSGNAILALASNAIHLLWKWQRNDRNATGKATASLPPQQWQPASGILMTNDVAETNPEEAVPCFALSKNDSYVMSASGGKISLFNMMTFKTMATFMPPPPAATFLAFHPQDNNIIAIGMDDSTIQIYNVRVDEVKSKLKGHSKRITGLAFSNVLNVLVSSGADAQLCVWNTDGWEKQKSKVLQIPQGRSTAALSDTRVQFHQDQVHFLVVHETQLAIYETTKLECMKQWPVRESSAPITHATFSCDSQLIYTSFMDATICVFSSANLRLRCRVNPSAYLPASLSNSNVHPLVIAAHPQESNMFAVGLSDGGVHIFEPLESEGKWGVAPPAENGSASAVTATPSVGASASDQPQR